VVGWGKSPPALLGGRLLSNEGSRGAKSLWEVQDTSCRGTGACPELARRGVPQPFFIPPRLGGLGGSKSVDKHPHLFTLDKRHRKMLSLVS